ncbi:MAG: hypothetical protein HC895_17055 [Leptolyngbyaceae cyanobacterium SM1_3_5]|nr:hypothetical protein [Leptolyngbyaceae cyanobacterium SM1_3_5]
MQAAHSGLTLAIVTQGAVSIAGEALPGIAQSPLWGMGKVIALEHPNLCCRQIDLDPTIPLNKQCDRCWPNCDRAIEKRKSLCGSRIDMQRG